MSSIRTLKLLYSGDDVVKMKSIDKSLIIYYDTNKTDKDELLKKFENTNFQLVPRDYVLHVSANSEEEFNKVFIKYKENVTIFSLQPRLIAKVIISNEDEYNNFINLDNENLRIKPYLHKLNFHDEKSKYRTKYTHISNNYNIKNYRNRKN